MLVFSNYAKNYASTVYKSLCGPCHWFRELEQSEDFSLLIYLDAVKFVLLSFFTLVKKIQLKSLAKPLPRNVKSPLPVHVCRSKTPLLSSLMIAYVLGPSPRSTTDCNRNDLA